uniref:Transmembrane protein 217 n=1 Tax=Suricata suricatta TaxID=37032 RepID=A0A673T796_SURSU
MNKTLSLVVGIFSILNTIQFLILELNHITYFGYEDKVHIYEDANAEMASWVMAHKGGISISLSTVTILFSVWLLYCIRTKSYLGPLCYALWIITYELISFSLVILVNGIIKYQFKELSYLYLIFQLSRMLLHFSSLPFIAKHTFVLYKDKDAKISVKANRHRHSSISTVDSW